MQAFRRIFTLQAFIGTCSAAVDFASFTEILFVVDIKVFLTVLAGEPCRLIIVL